MGKGKIAAQVSSFVIYSYEGNSLTILIVFTCCSCCLQASETERLSSVEKMGKPWTTQSCGKG